MDYQGTIADNMLIILISGVLHISYFRIYSACESHTVYFPITETCLSPAHCFLLNIRTKKSFMAVVVRFYFTPKFVQNFYFLDGIMFQHDVTWLWLAFSLHGMVTNG